MSHDQVNKGRETQDLAQKTIEHPTDVEDNRPLDSGDEFEHIANSPDIKLKSIDIDEKFTGKRKHHDEIQDDNSGTGHKAIPKKKTTVQQNSYGTLDTSEISNQRDMAVQLANDMKNAFLKFQNNFQNLQRPPSAESERSSRSVASIRSQRFVKLRKVSVPGDKDQLIQSLRAENAKKDERIAELERQL